MNHANRFLVIRHHLVPRPNAETSNPSRPSALFCIASDLIHISSRNNIDGTHFWISICLTSYLDFPVDGNEMAVLDEAGRVIRSVMIAVNFRVRKRAL